VEVEDYPISYIDFEGTIPQGQYGGGTVRVWDHGTFEPLTPVEGLKAGKLHFALAGKKLSGEWYLVRLRDGKQWLLIKGGASFPPVSSKQDDTSARAARGNLLNETVSGSPNSFNAWQPDKRGTKLGTSVQTLSFIGRR
jgi:bifunctional non-homologous end joining protein LigD